MATTSRERPLGGPLVIPPAAAATTSPNFNIGYQWVRNRNATT
jgi:hypothetical protein